jgi:hypothetical protein
LTFLGASDRVCTFKQEPPWRHPRRGGPR